MKQVNNFDLETIKFSDRQIFEIWHDRFVNEYNRSQQLRQGHILNLGTPQTHWNESFSHNVPPLWVKFGSRNIGFVSPQAITIGSSPIRAQQIQIISDVYIDPKFRGRGLLAAILLEQREQGREAILIDELKLLDNASYYLTLGFKFAMKWPEQELLIVSPRPLVDDELWTKIVPDNLLETVEE